MDQRSCVIRSFTHFVDVVRECCGASANWIVPRQVNYLRSYLEKNDDEQKLPKTLVIERPYVDRHYLEEYTTYYATSLRPPNPHASRIHVFSSDFDQPAWDEYLKKAAGGDLEGVQQELNESYLGFITVRPLPNTPVGRTLLRTYDGARGRKYKPVIRACSARILGIELKFDALPFVQQDQGVGACASVALWASLAKVARSAGTRAPTPFAVTQAATKNWVTDRVVPAAGGLELGQLANAVREFGFAPYTVKVNDNPQMFLWTLKVYLNSGVPAILLVRKENEMHALTVAGFKEGQRAVEMGEKPRVHRYASLERIYAHDDRIGPYGKMDLREGESDGWKRVEIHRPTVDDPTDGDFTRDAQVEYAIYPLYPKLRLTAAELATVAAGLGPLFKHLVGSSLSDSITTEGSFLLNGEYLKELYSLGGDAERIASMVKSTHFSRYLGVLRWYVNDEILADIVCDTTDIYRESDPYGSVLAVLLFDGRYVQPAKEMARGLVGDDKFY